MKKYNLIKFTALIIFVTVNMAFTLAEQGGKGPSTPHKTKLLAGDSYDLNINNWNMPVGRNGVLADVLIPPATLAGGMVQNKVVLYSGGFFMSGLNNGQIWSNGMMTSSRVNDYLPGTYATGQNDPRAQLYVVSASDPDFDIGVSDPKKMSWTQWKDAVALGADFYDGNHDGVYNPVDLNGNGKWDPDEDRPDILGDVTTWCVYSDQLPPPLRLLGFNDVNPQGIEIRQTVFAFNSKATAGNIIFIRYKIVNTGQVADVLDSVYFSVACDPDIGDNGALDLVGCDTTLNVGFTYHPTSESGKWGATPPCFLVDFFQGPRSYIPGVTFIDNNGNGVYDAGDTPIDTATDVRGRIMGIEKYPGAKNLGLSSFLQYYNGIDPANRFQLRYYTLGLDNKGSLIDPCTWTRGSVLGGVNCANVDPHFMYSGDPVTQIGWINNTAEDQRQISSTGPFQLVKNDTVSIVAAYVVGIGTNGLNSVTVAKQNDLAAQQIFDSNFPSLPAPPPVVYDTKTGNGFIDISFPIYKNILYHASDPLFGVNRNVHGFFITQFYSNAQSAFVNNQPNSQVIARYDLQDTIHNIFYKVANGGIDLRMQQAPPANKLDSLLAADPASGRIICRLTNDPSTGNPFIKGHEYYFSVTEYTVNNWAIVPFSTAPGAPGDFYDPTGTAVDEFESSLFKVTYGTDEYAPDVTGLPANKTNGPSKGLIKYIVADKGSLTGDTYKVDFISDKNPLDGYYTPYWSLKNTRTGVVLDDSSAVYNSDTTNYQGKVTEGFIPRIQALTPEFGTPVYSINGVATTDTSKIWYGTLYGTSSDRGVFYVGLDVPPPTSTKVGIGFDSISTGRSSIITADRLRKVELRFGDSSYAYRYINGYIGQNLAAQKGTTIYAGLIAGSDTTGKGPIGNWDAVNNHANGFIKVPFSAWVVDSAYNETRQLAVGFIERRASLGGKPDGIWDPATDVLNTREVILIFDSPYYDTTQIQYTGNSTTRAEVVKGYTLTAPGYSDSVKAIAKSPWFNTLYIVSLQRKDSRFFNPGDHFTIPVVTYPFTSTDEYQFKTVPGGNLTASETKSLFDKITVFPNPLYGYNPQTSYSQSPSDEPWVTFSNLPEQVTINIFTLSGTRLRTLTTADKSSPTSPFLKWNLQNEAGLRAASGMYLAIVSCPGLGDKVLKFAIIMPQKQIKNY